MTIFAQPTGKTRCTHSPACPIHPTCDGGCPPAGQAARASVTAADCGGTCPTHTTSGTLRDAKRQFCRTGIHACIPAVTLTFDGGTRRLHWCDEHQADAEQYRASADRPCDAITTVPVPLAATELTGA